MNLFVEMALRSRWVSENVSWGLVLVCFSWFHFWKMKPFLKSSYTVRDTEFKEFSCVLCFIARLRDFPVSRSFLLLYYKPEKSLKWGQEARFLERGLKLWLQLQPLFHVFSYWWKTLAWMYKELLVYFVPQLHHLHSHHDAHVSSFSTSSATLAAFCFSCVVLFVCLE